MHDLRYKHRVILNFFFFTSRRRNTRWPRDWSSDVCSSDLPQARLNDIELKWVQKNNQSIYCDKTQIKQVLINIIKNAIEAMNEPGTIEIEQVEVRNHIVIRVIDEGSGIPEEIIHKLGEPFFTTKQTGTGLGLMITKQILTHHDGSIEVFHNNKKGSTFQIQLPKSK